MNASVWPENPVHAMYKYLTALWSHHQLAKCLLDNLCPWIRGICLIRESYHQILPTGIVMHPTKQPFSSHLLSNQYFHEPSRSAATDGVALDTGVGLLPYSNNAKFGLPGQFLCTHHIVCCCYLSQYCLSVNKDYSTLMSLVTVLK